MMLFSFTVDAKQHRSSKLRQSLSESILAHLLVLLRGRCEGYIIDHIKPLACGGTDSPENMQWQTEEESKAKDKWERVDCEMYKSDVP